MDLVKMFKDSVAAPKGKPFKAKKYPKQKPLLDDRSFIYKRACETNVLETFKRHGWTPPSEVKQES